jgi:hypothetical protein
LSAAETNTTGPEEVEMSTYETPTITELGTVEEFTRADRWALSFDGVLLHKGNSSPTPTS